MRTDSENTKTLDVRKARAMEEQYGNREYVVVNDKLIEFSSIERVLVLTAEERAKAETDTIIHTISSSDLDLLAAFVPNDMEPSLMMKYVALIIADDEVDAYTTNRMIQQLIDDELYVREMLDIFIQEGSSPLTEEQVVAVEDDSEETYESEGTELYPSDSIYLLPLTPDPDEVIIAHFEESEWGIQGLWNVSEESTGSWIQEGGTLVTPLYQEIVYSSLDEIIKHIEGEISNLAEKDCKIYLSKRNIMRVNNPDDPSGKAWYTCIYSVTATNSSMSPSV